jgi:hypothetical protein
MAELTSEAQERLARYLAQVQASLTGCRSVDPEEVTRDVNEHIERELAGQATPVTGGALEAVLGRLGSPDQWVPADERSWWSRFVTRLRFGPDDWRLSYITLGLLVTVAFLGPLGLLLSFIAARATLTAADGTELGARRWLVYPSLILVYVPLAVSVVFWPLLSGPLAFAALWHPHGADGIRIFNLAADASTGIVAGAIAVGTSAIYWIVLGLVLRARPQWVKALFRPFAEWFTARWARLLWVTGLVVILIALLGSVLFMA